MYESEVWLMKWLENSGVTTPKGFEAAGIHAGIKNKKLDLGLIRATHVCPTAAVYTTNVVQAGCIQVTKTHLHNQLAQAVVVNSGNANACTPRSKEDAEATCQAVAAALHIDESDVIVASTGVIGQPLPLEKIKAKIPALVQQLASGAEADAQISDSILTTDLIKKQAACRINIGGKDVTIAGIAKGSGMIHPKLATMLCFLTTDADISPDLLQKALSETTVPTFNSISVDGDTSTNDMSTIMASGAAKNPPIVAQNDDYETFKAALEAVCLVLAKKIVQDGEGATKLFTCVVHGAQTPQDAHTLALSVTSSSLVKTALTGADANWGRILCAMGYAGVAFDAKTVEVAFESAVGAVTVCVDGMGLAFDEALAKRILEEKEITIAITIKTENHTSSWTTYGCNLTNQYVEINGSYRS